MAIADELNISPSLQKLYDDIIAVPENRANNFQQIAQSYFKALHGQDLKKAVFHMWIYFCYFEKDWKGKLLIPNIYRQSILTPHPMNVFYTIKEYFMWAALYPKEVHNQFLMLQDGNIDIIGDVSIRIVSKEVRKEKFIDTTGKLIHKDIKPSLDFILDSGFTIQQKNDLVDTCMIGLLADIVSYKDEALKPTKKTKTTKAKKTKEIV